jgi:hypothetical protein
MKIIQKSKTFNKNYGYEENISARHLKYEIILIKSKNNYFKLLLNKDIKNEDINFYEGDLFIKERFKIFFYNFCSFWEQKNDQLFGKHNYLIL